MPKLRLSELVIERIKPTDRQVTYWDTTLPGFNVRCSQSGTKTYTVVHGEDRRRTSIARFGDISLTDARKKAMGILSRKAHKNVTTRLTGLVETFLADCETRLRPSSVQRYRDVLDKAPDISLDNVTKKLASTAHEIKAYKALFNFAEREELYDKNPFKHLRATYGERSRILTDEELKKIWNYQDGPFSDILRLLILTGQRKSQIWKLDPSWVKEREITFPASIMKQGHPHTIPYGDLTAAHLSPPYSFNGFSKSKVRIDKETGITGWVLHDLRRSFATIHARIGTPIHIVEALLAHTSGQISGVTAIYVRHDFMKEMREAVKKYENHLQSILL